MRTIKDEMGIWQNKSLPILSSIELIPIAYFYAERGHEKDAFFFSVSLQLTPIGFEDFLGAIFDFYK